MAMNMRWCARAVTCANVVWYTSLCMRTVHEKNHVWGVSMHLPSVTVDRHRLQTKPTVTKKSLNIFLWAHFQFHSDVSHHEVLEEGCHLLYCPGEMDSATCSPDSRWRRFLRASSSKMGSKSQRPIFARLVQGEIPVSSVSFKFLCWEMIRTVFFCKFVHLFALLFRPSDCELWFTSNWISEKSIVNTCKMSALRVNSFAASLPRIPGNMVLFLFFGFAVSSTMTTPFLDSVVRDRVHPILVLCNFLLDSLSSKKCPQVQYTMPWFQKRRQWEHCTFGKVSHNSNNYTLPISRIIAFELSLSGL